MPRVINYSGALKDALGHSISGISGATFLIYKDQDGGAPLWLETQSIQADGAGRYTVQSGAASVHGLPADIFMTGEGRWLAVRIGSEPELPRVLLVAVPYALKAADAETIGGLPLVGLRVGSRCAGCQIRPQPNQPPHARDNIRSTADHVRRHHERRNCEHHSALWDSDRRIKVPVPHSNWQRRNRQDRNWQRNTSRHTRRERYSHDSRNLSLPSAAAATATAGKASQPQKLIGSSFSSTTATPVNQNFRWQTEPAANNTASNSGTLNLLYAIGTNAPLKLD